MKSVYSAVRTTFCKHAVSMCLLWFPEQRSVISLYKINLLDFVIQMQFVHCEVHSAMLCILKLNLHFKLQMFCLYSSWFTQAVTNESSIRKYIFREANLYELLTMRVLFSVLILKTVFVLSPYRAGQTYPIEGWNILWEAAVLMDKGKRNVLYICVRFISQHSSTPQDILMEW